MMPHGARAATSAALAPAPGGSPGATPLRGFLGVFGYSRRALQLVWQTNRRLFAALALLTLAAGLLPASIPWIAGQIIDAVVGARASAVHDATHVLWLVVLEGAAFAALTGARRGLSLCQSLLRAQLGQRVNMMILEKALTLELQHFEDSQFYDKLTRARREASSRPLSLVTGTFGLAQSAISLISFALLLAQFSPWTLLVLLIAGFPAFVAETKFSGDGFRLYRWRSPQTRMQLYLETVLAREDHAKEVKLYGLGPRLLRRYHEIFQRLYGAERALAIRSGGWGFGLSLLGTGTLYGACAWVALSAVRGAISLGGMTMYLSLFRQGQTSVSTMLSSVGGMYEDNLYLSTLYEYLETPVTPPGGRALSGPSPGDGVRFEHVSFTYPGAAQPAVQDIDLHLPRGTSLALVGENGSGKTTLIKLLTRLYRPDAGRILLDALPLEQWQEEALRARIGVIFQDFARYQLLVGENVGAGDERHFDDEDRWRRAAEDGRAADFIERLPGGYRAQLGKWFPDGQELSGGQWQKIALARAFMRTEADVLVLDEPTAALDARAEAQIFEHFRALARERITILISHRFSTVRMADQIAVLDHGRIIERGNHDQLMRLGGRYAGLFNLQARGYR